MELLSKRKIKKIMEKGEIISVGEFIKRYNGDTMGPFGMDLFFSLYIQNSRHLIVHYGKYPIMVERRK